MYEMNLLINIAMALLIAFIGGAIARRFGLPTILGYLVSGIIIGPFTPGFTGDTNTISQLANLGIIFLMFGVGLNFSLRDLWRAREVAIPGALIQTVILVLLTLLVGRWLGWPLNVGLVMGLAFTNCSTVVMMRNLMDHGLLGSSGGQAATGLTVVEDLMTVLVLVLLPVMVGSGDGFSWQVLGLTLLKAALFVLVLIFAGSRMIPWMLMRTAFTRSRELWILAILAVALGTALAAAQIFGVSLALGAFVAGVVVSESPLSRQVSADVLPFQEAFAVIFFVSVGMLVNPAYLVTNIGPILVLTALIVVGKPLIILVMGMILPWPARTTLVVAATRGQVSEFAFILGQVAMALAVLNSSHYSLILAVTFISISVNIFMFRLPASLEKRLMNYPVLWRLLDRQDQAAPQAPEPESPCRADHVVIVGYGRVGHNTASLLRGLHIPFLVVHDDPEQGEELQRQGIPSLFGDAANSEVLTHAGLECARALVVAGPDETACEMVVAAAHQLAPNLPVIARAGSREGISRLSELGARHVIHPEMEGGLEIVRHTLMLLGFPIHEVTRYIDSVRQDHYDLEVDTEEEMRVLRHLVDAVDGLEVAWFTLRDGNPLVGRTLASANLRAHTGASVVAILRGRQLLANPKSQAVFEAGDRVGFIGDAEHLEAVEKLMSGTA